MIRKFILLAIFFASPFFILIPFSSPYERIMTECTGHIKGNHHYHARLGIRQDNKIIPVPANIGINGDCIHPLHTHDSTGLVHIDYTKEIDVTLGDLFDTMGIIFSDEQMGSLKKFDGYEFKVNISGKTITNALRDIELHDQDLIEVSANKK